MKLVSCIWTVEGASHDTIMKLLVTILALVAMVMADNTLELLKKANNQFTAKMFTEVLKNNPDNSVVLSAFSVLTPLSLLSFATVGESHDEILRVVGFPNDNATKEVATVINNEVRAVKGVELKMANRVYVAQGYELKDDFESVARSVFGTDIRNVNFIDNEKTAKTINTWVEEQTNNRIKDLVDPNTLDSDTRAVLVNALYFKGAWKDKFEVAETEERDFHVSKDKTIKVPTMHRIGLYRYAENRDLGAKLLELPYAGNEVSMLLVLPLEVDGIAALEEKLRDPVLLENAIEELHTFYTVDLHLPKFKIETKTDLKEVLKKMDIKKIFSFEEARLFNLLKTNSSLAVCHAVQKAFIEVNEEGAEAAAANDITLYDRIGGPRLFVEFDSSHPFFFMVKMKSTILFEGIFKY